MKKLINNGDYYGKGFKEWLTTAPNTKSTSYGNGCLMRISPFMYLDDPLPGIMQATLCSHYHGISVDSVYKLYKMYKGSFVYGTKHVANQKIFQVEADATIDKCIQICSLNNEYTTRELIIYTVSQGGDTDTNASIVGEYSNFVKNDINLSDVVYVHMKLDGYLLDILQSYNEFLQNDENKKNGNR